MPPPAGRGSLKATMDALVGVAVAYHSTLTVYRWWRPDMQLPAVWHWLTPGDVEAAGVPTCKVIDTLRVTQTIAVDPTAIAGEGDMLELEAYADLALPLLDAAIYAPEPLGQRNARRRGFQTVADELGGASILCLELPLEVELHRPVNPA